MTVDSGLAATARSRVRLLVLAAALATLLAFVGTASSASANTGNFCPASGTMSLKAYQSPNNTDRCAWAYHSSVTEVWYDNQNIAHVCAAVKANSNGSGADQGVPADCPTSNGAAIAIIPGGVGGYSTGINHSSADHTEFLGWLAYT